MSAKKRKRVATMAQRRAANIRERRRMFNLNEAFDKLRRKVPTFAYEKRLSRIETLRLAITYIGFMDQVIHVDPKPKAKVNPAPFAAAADSAADQFNESWWIEADCQVLKTSLISFSLLDLNWQYFQSWAINVEYYQIDVHRFSI